jgi:hypothetical protein
MDHHSKSTGGGEKGTTIEWTTALIHTEYDGTHRVEIAEFGIKVTPHAGSGMYISVAAARAIAKAILALTSDAQAPAPVAAPAPIAAAKPAPKRHYSRHPWGKLRIGETFFVAGTVRPNPKGLEATNGKRFTTRAATEDGVDGFLVWRMP